MLKSNPEIEVISLYELDETPTKHKHPWKLYALTIFAVVSLILVNVCPPLKNGLYELGVEINSVGFLGPLLFLLFNGLIVIPLALPYLVFEMTTAILIQDFLEACSYALLGRMLGAAISYILTKYLLKQRIRDSFRGIKVYKGIEHVMEKNPIKFSLILRVVLIPLFLKNYGLALPDSVNFKLYMVCSLITSLPIAVMNVYLSKQAGDLGSLFSGEQSMLHKVFSVVMIVLSISLMVYLVKYTKKIIREIEAIDLGDDKKESDKDIEMQADTKAAEIQISEKSGDQSPSKDGMIPFEDESNEIEEEKDESEYDKATAF